MKLGFISDIHGEFESLKKALSFLKGKACKLFCLGDLVSEDSEENELCINLIKELGIDTVLGQHDDTCVKTNSPPVSSDARNFLKSLPITIDKDNLFFVHDNPLEKAREGKGMWSQGSYIKSSLESDVVFEDLPDFLSVFQFFFIGHTHVPKVFSSKTGEIDFQFDTPMKLESDEKYIVNPGRIGGVDRYSMGVSCAIFDTESHMLTIAKL